MKENGFYVIRNLVCILRVIFYMMHLENIITNLGNAGLIRDQRLPDWPGYRNANAVLTQLTTGLNADA
jgi:hypothetical protein